MEIYKAKIIDYIEGRTAPETFYTWFESDPRIMDWLQSMIPTDKTIQDCVKVKIDYFLKNLKKQQQDEIYSAYQKLCQSMGSDNDDQINCAKALVDLLYAADQSIVKFTDYMNLLLHNYKSIFEDPHRYNSSYLQDILRSIKDFFEKTHDTIQEVPYNVKNVYSQNKTNSKIWTYVNIQSWLYDLMTELYPEEDIKEDETLYEKASFMMDVCPEYIEGHEIDEAGIIEAIIEQASETLPKSKRKKQIKELIKKEFHIEGTKYPRWVQGGEWPISKSGKPMRYLEQKRKKGKEYETMLYTQFFFEDVETGEIRVIDQFT